MSWGEPNVSWRDREAWQALHKTYACDQTLNPEELPWVEFREPSMHYPFLK